MYMCANHGCRCRFGMFICCCYVYSASVRRTSMRDKSKLSWKEALDEAKHLRGGPAPIDQNGDEDTEAEITQKVSSLEEDEKELSTSQSASATVSL